MGCLSNRAILARILSSATHSRWLLFLGAQGASLYLPATVPANIFCTRYLFINA